jgi:hypothetical protein
MIRKIKLKPLLVFLGVIAAIAVFIYLIFRTPFEGISEKLEELKKKIDRDLSYLKIAEQTQKRLMDKANSLFKYLAISVQNVPRVSVKMCQCYRLNLCQSYRPKMCH